MKILKVIFGPFDQLYIFMWINFSKIYIFEIDKSKYNFKRKLQSLQIYTDSGIKGKYEYLFNKNDINNRTK
jgi:hypothetical protein